MLESIWSFYGRRLVSSEELGEAAVLLFGTICTFKIEDCVEVVELKIIKIKKGSTLFIYDMLP